jgi:hypothetical protein
VRAQLRRDWSRREGFETTAATLGRASWEVAASLAGRGDQPFPEIAETVLCLPFLSIERAFRLQTCIQKAADIVTFICPKIFGPSWQKTGDRHG